MFTICLLLCLLLLLLLQLSMEKAQAMAEQVEIKAKVVQTEVKAIILRHRKALEERECELLWKVSSSHFSSHGCGGGGGGDCGVGTTQQQPPHPGMVGVTQLHLNEEKKM